jgi:hypothetical protein
MPAIRMQNKEQPDGRRVQSFDLKDILTVIGEAVIKSRWRCRDLWLLASFNGQSDSYRMRRLKASGEELMLLASKTHQTIDGRFEARSEGAAKHPWLIIVTFDSSWFEVWSSKPWVIERLKSHFMNTTDITDISGILSEPVKVE